MSSHHNRATSAAALLMTAWCMFSFPLEVFLLPDYRPHTHVALAVLDGIADLFFLCATIHAAVLLFQQRRGAGSATGAAYRGGHARSSIASTGGAGHGTTISDVLDHQHPGGGDGGTEGSSSSWVVVCLGALSVLPLDYIFHAVGVPGSWPAALFRCTRFLQIWIAKRHLRVVDSMLFFQCDVYTNRAAKLFLSLACLCHYSACSWCWVSRREASMGLSSWGELDGLWVADRVISGGSGSSGSSGSGGGGGSSYGGGGGGNGNSNSTFAVNSTSATNASTTVWEVRDLLDPMGQYTRSLYFSFVTVVRFLLTHTHKCPRLHTFTYTQARARARTHTHTHTHTQHALCVVHVCSKLLTLHILTIMHYILCNNSAKLCTLRLYVHTTHTTTTCLLCRSLLGSEILSPQRRRKLFSRSFSSTSAWPSPPPPSPTSPSSSAASMRVQRRTFLPPTERVEESVPISYEPTMTGCILQCAKA